MANEQINYKAVLADLEAKKLQIESAIAAIKMVAAQGGTLPPGMGGSDTVEPSTFLGFDFIVAGIGLAFHTTAEKLAAAAAKIKHWHDTNDGGMVVSGEAVRELWGVLAEYERRRA